jgi:hypothetical protein
VNGDELYDVENDLLQKENIAEKYPDVLSKLSDHYNN